MKLFDLNILIYAHREDQAHHDYYRQALEEIVRGREPFGLSPLVATGFVRIVTHARFPNGPTPLPQALAVIDALASLKQCHWVHSGVQHWELVSSLCRKCLCSGKLVADAQHAALAIENACTWVTRDSDFQRFAKLGLRLEILDPTPEA